ncbi:MAG TPA: hypothetical protein VFU29_16040 [Chitinophagaceae bacterium]|nr:hypothetical protein [Chitinophagaceae bacterium]
MKKLILIIAHPFRQRKNTFTILFSEAMAEGIRDTMKEMGYFFEPSKTRSVEVPKDDKFQNLNL